MKFLTPILPILVNSEFHLIIQRSSLLNTGRNALQVLNYQMIPYQHLKCCLFLIKFNVVIHFLPHAFICPPPILSVLEKSLVDI